MDKLFRIGDVARLFHLSVSSLRHYEDEGLLVPEKIDPDTGYRYYSVRQFEVLNTIRYLRALDMPLSEIGDFLKNRDVEKIEEKLLRQKQAVAEKRRELLRIERRIDNRLARLREAQDARLGGGPPARRARLPGGLAAEGAAPEQLPGHGRGHSLPGRVPERDGDFPGQGGGEHVGRAPEKQGGTISTMAFFWCWTTRIDTKVRRSFCPKRSARRCAFGAVIPRRLRSTPG